MTTETRCWPGSRVSGSNKPEAGPGGGYSGHRCKPTGYSGSKQTSDTPKAEQPLYSLLKKKQVIAFSDTLSFRNHRQTYREETAT